MTTEEKLQKIGELAVKAHQARVAKDTAREYRGSFWCRREGEQDHEWPHIAKYYAADAPCWKAAEDTDDGDIDPLEESEWCPKCRSRQVAHRMYLKRSSTLGALRGALTRACGKHLQEKHHGS